MVVRNSSSIYAEWPHFLCILIVTFGVYLWSMPGTVVLEDDGIFILASYFNGIAHPPGYPLYTLLGHLASYFPAGNIAVRIHALSAILASAACILLWILAFRLLAGRIYAYIAGFGFAFSQGFWSQAIIAEVYTLNIFLFLLLFILILNYRENPESKRLFWLACFIFGLALSNHWPLMILSSPLFAFILWPVRIKSIKNLPAGLFFLGAGLFPYLWMVLRSHMDPLISFYGPITGLSDFIFFVSREGYEAVDKSASAGWLDKFQFAGYFMRESAAQFGSIGLIVACLGFIHQWKVFPKSQSLGLLCTFITTTFFLISLLGFDFDLAHKNIFRVYPLPAYCIMALWLALGAKFIVRILTTTGKIRIEDKYARYGLLVLLVGTIFLINLPMNYRAGDRLAADYAELVLRSLEEDAIFFTQADLDTGPIGYMNKIENIRPDVTLYNGQGLVFSNRLYHPIKTSGRQKKSILNNFLSGTERPVYFSTSLHTDYGFEDYGLYAKINEDITREERKIILLPAFRRFFESLFQQPEPVDPWELMFYRLLESEYCRVSASQVLFAEHVPDPAPLSTELKQVCRGYYGLIELAELVLYQEQPDWDSVRSILKEAKEMQDQAIRIEDVVAVENLWGKYFQRRDRSGLAREHLLRSIEIWPNPKNRAYKMLRELGDNGRGQ